MTTATRLAWLLPLVLLCGCDNKVTIDLTDGPTDGAQEIVLDLASVALITEDDEVVELDLEDGDPIDILAFQKGETFRLVDDRSLDEHRYVGIALQFDPDGSFLVDAAGAEIPIVTPTTITYADVDFEVDQDSEIRLVLDLNMRFSLIDNDPDGATLDLDPVLRAVDVDDAGTVTGSVAAAIVESTACQQGRDPGVGVAVYAFTGSGVTPADYDGQSNLVDAANVELDTGTGEYRYELHFLEKGPYTLALTCEADADDPSLDDAITFESSADVTVNAGSTATLDFL